MWGEGPSRVAHAANLLVTIAACAADPSGLSVTGAAATGALSLKDIFKASTPDAKALIASLTAELQDGLDRPAFHMPARGPALLPQMIEASLPTPAQIIGSRLDVDALLGLMLDRLTDTEHRAPEMAEAFCNWVRPSLARLLADRTFTETLAPMIARETLTRLTELADGLVSLSTTYGSLARALDDLRNLHQSQLEVVALRFGLAPARGADAGQLIRLLDQKAEDLRALTADTHAMRGLSDRTDNILSAIEADIADLRLSDAREKLAAAREVQAEVLRKPLEFNAALMERQAQVALLENQPENAFTIFSAAADSFSPLGAVEVAERRRSYAERLTLHGIRYGGAGLPLAIRLLDRLLADLPQDAAPWDWAAAQNSLAIACQNLGQRSDGPPGTALLARAARANEATLQVVVRDSDPVHWAIAMQNLAVALQAQGQRTAGEDGTTLLSRAIEAYELALQVRTRADHPVDWATTMQNLAVAMRNQGDRTAGEEGTTLLSRSIEAYEQALQVFTRVDHPVQWATTMQNLAVSLQAKGRGTTGEGGTALLSRAVAAIEQALQVRTRADHPVQWAGTMQNLANALALQGERSAGVDGTSLLSRAVAANKQALQVFTRTDHPVDWAKTLENLAICNVVWSEHPACDNPPAHLRQALAHVDAALTVYDPDHMPYDHGTATRLRESILSALATNS